MNNEETTEYQLVQMDEASRKELTEIKRQELSSKFTDFSNSLFVKIQSYLSSAPEDVKTILALNYLLQREFDQHLACSLGGMEQALTGIRDKTLLANNNLIYPDVTNLATEQSVYLLIEPETINEYGDDEEEYLSNSEKVRRAVEIFELDQVEYKLYLFLNTDNYDMYVALEKDLRATVGRDFDIISTYPDIDIITKAEVVVHTFPEKSIHDIANHFLVSFGLFANRRKKIYFNYELNSKTGSFGPLDFLLLAHSNLNNLLIKKELTQPLAKHFTDIWLGENSSFKHRYEEIGDFFESPSVVMVQGLSPVYGVITKRKMAIQGARIDLTTGEETLLDFEIDSSDEIEGLYTEEELMIYMKASPKNLRNRLIRWKEDVIRVESIEKTLQILGKNLNNTNKNVNTYTLTGDFSSLVFLTPYHMEKYYNNILNVFKSKGSIPYKLPERFKMYLLRLASYRGLEVPEVDSKWFSKNNRSLTEVLAVIGDKFRLDNILGHSISPIHGIVNTQILVNLEELKCLTREN